MGRPGQVRRNLPEPASDQELDDDPPLVEPVTFRAYVRGWLWILMLVSPTAIICVGIYLLVR